MKSIILDMIVKYAVSFLGFRFLKSVKEENTTTSEFLTKRRLHFIIRFKAVTQ